MWLLHVTCIHTSVVDYIWPINKDCIMTSLHYMYLLGSFLKEMDMLCPLPHQEMPRNLTLLRLIVLFILHIVEDLPVPQSHVVPVSIPHGDNIVWNPTDQTQGTTLHLLHPSTSSHIPVDAGPIAVREESHMKIQMIVASLEGVLIAIILKCQRVWTLLLEWTHTCLS